MTHQVGTDADGDESSPLFMNRAFVLLCGRDEHPLATDGVRVLRIAYIPSPFLPSPILHQCHNQQSLSRKLPISLFTLEAFPWSSYTYPVVFPFRNRSQLMTALPAPPRVPGPICQN
jgi:hypothetical protein